MPLCSSSLLPWSSLSRHGARLRLGAPIRRGRLVAAWNLDSFAKTVPPATTTTRSFHHNPNQTFLSAAAAASSSWDRTFAAALFCSGSAAAWAAYIATTNTTTTHCEDRADPTVATDDTSISEDTTPLSSSQQSLPPSKPNPFWPSGVDQGQVDRLVDDCLNDPSINLKAIPDVLERQIYASTIQLTLNVIYQTLAGLHGTPILAHELQLRRVSPDGNLNNTTTTADQVAQQWLSVSHKHSGGVDETLLEQVADRLLQNQAVQQTMIPNVIERQIYVNCLKIVFRLLDLISASVAVTVCGHEFRLAMEPVLRQQVLEQELQETVLQKDKPTATAQHQLSTPINRDLLLEYAAQEAGIDMHAAVRQSWWSRFWHGPRLSDEFVIQLHSSLYSLLLGILDDLLEQTQITLLSDTVQMDLVPVPEHLRELRKQQQSAGSRSVGDSDNVATTSNTNDSGEGGGYLPLASFTMGVGVGLTLMALVVHGKSFK